MDIDVFDSEKKKMRVGKGLEMEPKKTINNDVVALLLELG